MPKLIGGILALVALAAGSLGGVDPIACVLRAVVAYLVGMIATQVWYVFFTIRVIRDGDESATSTEEAPILKESAG